jgi:pimeloyl-ACP methyl ester carboxylesterase
LQESALCWLRVAKVLERDYDLVLIDARGHGLSDRADTAFTPHLLTEDAAGVIGSLKTQRHEERMVCSLRLLPPGAPLLPEDEYVPLVEASARVDLDLVLLGNELWSRARQQYEEARQLQTRITCPVLLLYSAHFPAPGTPVTLREEPAERPNEKIVRFEHAGHLIYREHFEQFVAVIRPFLKDY